MVSSSLSTHVSSYSIDEVLTISTVIIVPYKPPKNRINVNCIIFLVLCSPRPFDKIQRAHPMKYAHGSRFVLLCFYLVSVDFTHLLGNSYDCSITILYSIILWGIVHSQWENHEEEYGWMNHTNITLRQNGRIFLNENILILIKISLNFVLKGQINSIPALVQITTWRRPSDKPLSEPMMVSLLAHICVTRPQWKIRHAFLTCKIKPNKTVCCVCSKWLFAPSNQLERICLLVFVD